MSADFSLAIAGGDEQPPAFSPCIWCGLTGYPLDKHGYCTLCNRAMERINASGMEP